MSLTYCIFSLLSRHGERVEHSMKVAHMQLSWQEKQMEDDADRHYTVLFNQKSGLHAGSDCHVRVCAWE